MDCLYTLAAFHVCTLPIKFHVCTLPNVPVLHRISICWSEYHVNRNEKQAGCVFGCIDVISVYPHLFVSLSWNSYWWHHRRFIFTTSGTVFSRILPHKIRRPIGWNLLHPVFRQRIASHFVLRYIWLYNFACVHQLWLLCATFPF